MGNNVNDQVGNNGNVDTMYNIASKIVELFQRSLPSSAVPRIVLKQPRKRCGNPQRWFTIS